MAGWIEIEIISLVILISFIAAVVLDWTVYRNYCFITLCG
jgi:hypothetical protein